MAFGRKNWDRRVGAAEALACGPGLWTVRDRVLELAAPAGAHSGSLRSPPNGAAYRCDSQW